jgi:hypothetical protein
MVYRVDSDWDSASAACGRGTREIDRYLPGAPLPAFRVTEFILTYDGKPSYTVSIMEFKGDKVARETQYFADPFAAPASRAQWVERMDT